MKGGSSYKVGWGAVGVEGSNSTVMAGSKA